MHFELRAHAGEIRQPAIHRRPIHRTDRSALFGADLPMDRFGSGDEIRLAPTDPADDLGQAFIQRSKRRPRPDRQPAGDGIGLPMRRLPRFFADRDQRAGVQRAKARGVVGVEGLGKAEIQIRVTVRARRGLGLREKCTIIGAPIDLVSNWSRAA
jgi:hypothetical protein